MQAAEQPYLEQAARPASVLPAPLLLVFLCGAALGLLSANPLLTVAAILVLPLFIVMLWRPGEPPVLLFAVGFQWVQVTAKVFQANIQGVHVDVLASASSIESVIWMSLGGLVVLSAGIWLPLRKARARGPEVIEAEIAKVSIHRAFLFYAVATVVLQALRELAKGMGGLRQPLMELSAIRWVFFFLLVYIIFRRREFYIYFILAFGFEFISGIGFFSGFKTVIFFTLIAVGAAFFRLSAKTVLIGVTCGILLLILGSAWTAVKSDYRSFVSGGERTQKVTVDRSDQLSKLGNLVMGLNRADLGDGMDALFRRVSYVDYFGHVTDYVPDVQPHEGGAIWKATVLHIVQPRMFFPQKPQLPSDSEMTMYYTGLVLASDQSGTSISIGYMGESYIDFGPYGMFIPIFILGLLWGSIYRYFISRSRVQILGFSMAAAVLLGAYMLEIASIKLIGGMIMKFLVFVVVMRFLEPFFWRRLCSEGPSAETVSPVRGSLYGAASHTA